MGAMLPQMLQNIGRGPGSLGPMQAGAQVIPAPTQAQSAPPSTAANVMSGIASFLQNYSAGRRAQKDTATKEAMQGIQLMQLGIPVDKEKLAKKLKLSGLGDMLDFEGNEPVQGMASSAQPQPQQAPPDQNGVSMPQATPEPAIQQMLMNGAVKQPPTPAAPQQGIGSRIAQGMGFSAGPVNQSSSGMSWLNELAKQGQQNKEFGQEEMAQRTTEQHVRSGMLDVLSKAIKGDPNALELASRFPAPYGLKDMPLDGMLKLGRMQGMKDTDVAKAVMYHTLGGPQALQHMQQLAKDFAPHFNNDLSKAMQYVMDTTNTGQSSLRPAMSMEQQIKVQDMADRLAAKYPTAPMNMLMTYANLKASGNDKPAGEILSYLSKQYKREGEISGEQFRITDDYHRKMMAQTMSIHADNINLARQNAIIQAAGDQGKTGWEMMKSKDEATRMAGAQLLASSANKQNELDMTFRDADGKMKTIPLGAGKLTASMVNHWFSPNQPGFNFEGGGADMNQFIDGGKPKKGFSLGDAMMEGRKQVERMLLEMFSGNSEN